ncbi:MAG TPA: hypothetical protein V6D19_07385 [Stenomitos sp.]
MSESSKSSEISFVAAWAYRISLNIVLGGFGIGLIAYELWAGLNSSRWSWLDSNAQYISTWLTLLGTICTAGSIYFYTEKTTPPEKMSVCLWSPIILTMCLVSIFYLIIKGSLPSNTVNSFALLAIAGALFRIQPHPLQNCRLFWERKRRT